MAKRKSWPGGWESIKAGIFAGESGGDYDALYKYSQRPGGRFAGTRLTDMTVDEAIQFAHPSGPYAQWVKANNKGVVATPMGGFQIVGSTLKKAKDWAGLSGSEQMTPEIQDRLGQAILANQGTGAWKGYKGPRQSGPTYQVGPGFKGPNPYAPSGQMVGGLGALATEPEEKDPTAAGRAMLAGLGGTMSNEDLLAMAMREMEGWPTTRSTEAPSRPKLKRTLAELPKRVV